MVRLMSVAPLVPQVSASLSNSYLLFKYFELQILHTHYIYENKGLECFYFFYRSEVLRQSENQSCSTSYVGSTICRLWCGSIRRGHLFYAGIAHFSARIKHLDRCMGEYFFEMQKNEILMSSIHTLQIVRRAVRTKPWPHLDFYQC